MQTNQKRWSPFPWLLAFFIGGPLLLLFVILIGISSFFWVSPEIRTLRNAVLENSSGQFHRKIELNVGRASFGLAKFASGFINGIPEEARMALSSAKGAQVSIYRGHGTFVDARKLLATADQQMEKRGWYRLVGVSKDDNLLAIYTPKLMDSANDVEACVLVLNREQLVCAYGRSDLQPLFKLAMQKAKMEFPELAMQ